MSKSFIFIVGMLIISTLGCNSPKENQEAKTTKSTSPIEEKNMVEEIELVDLQNNPIDLKDYSGKKIFLNFWATWCGPCIEEMPSIRNAQQILEAEGYVFLMASDESLKRLQRFAKKQSEDLPLIQTRTSINQLGMYSLPTTYIIGPNGKILSKIEEARPWDSAQNIAFLRGL